MSGNENSGKKRNNYKLLVDPELRKGHKKLYRLNGKDVPGMPPVGEPRDPRTQKTVLGMSGSCMELAIPRFKYDKDWVGDPPERDVFVIGLNEAMKSSLRETCSQLYPIHAIKFHHHPKTRTFLGAATVAFTHTGHGKKAVGELDGKIVGGCYLRAELDDKGEHLKKYLEPVLKKCGLERRPLKSASSDVDEGPTRSNSVTESSHEMSESDTELSLATPSTPTGRRQSSTFLAPSATKLYPFSSLHLLSVSTTPSTDSPSLLSPTFSLDSGIGSLKHGSGSGLSPGNNLKFRTNPIKGPPPRLNCPPPIPTTPPPPLPPSDFNAPPLPPLEQTAPPPLPPHSPHPPATDHGVSGGIENISSDEESTPVIRDPRRASLTKPSLDILSPVSISPPFSPKSRAPNHAKSNSSFPRFADPSLGLQTLLAARGSEMSSTKPASSLPFAQPTTSSPMTYEPEVEDISGDESPVMVYNTPNYDIQVESVSEDEGEEGGGEDMEVCSDDEDNVIEVNVVPMLRKPIPLPPILPSHPPPPLPPPLPGFPPPPPRPPHFFPPHGGPAQFLHHRPPPPQIFPPHPRPPPPTAIHPGFKSSPQPPFLHPPNGFVDNFPPSTRLLPSSRYAGKIKRDLVPPPKDKKASISRDVMYKALEQLRMILINDVQKKLVERYAYRALENYWEKMEDRKHLTQEQRTEGGGGAEKPSYHVAPYRRMLPGLKVREGGGLEGGEGSREHQREGEEEDEEEEVKSIPTPRKRLMNFKIPIINRGDQRRGQRASVVTRRRLFSEEDETRETGKGTRTIPLSSRRSSYMGMTSDISSEELSEPGEEEEREGEGSEVESVSDIFGESSSEEDETEMLQRIFGGSEESEDSEPVRTRPPKKQRRLSSNEVPTFPEKTVKSPEDLLKEEICQEHRTTASGPDIGIEASLPLEPHISLRTTVESPSAPVAPVKRPMFKARCPEDEEKLACGLLGDPPDREDIVMLRLALGRMKGEGEELVGGVSWAYHPHVPLGAPPTKRRRLDSQDQVPHTTGCARSEGYYKIDARDKVKYLPHHRMKLKLNEKVEKKVTSSGRVNRANQRRLASVFSTGDVSSDLAKYNQLKARKKLLKFAKSTIHNWGLFAIEDIAADEMVIEYVGEIIRQAVADERERRYEAAGIGSSYLFRVDHDYIIDATRNGNMARFINHCCDPNCYAKVISFGTQKKIVIYSKRDISLGEEITYDYKFPIEDEKIPCLCGAPNCRGTLN